MLNYLLLGITSVIMIFLIFSKGIAKTTRILLILITAPLLLLIVDTNLKTTQNLTRTESHSTPSGASAAPSSSTTP